MRNEIVEDLDILKPEDMKKYPNCVIYEFTGELFPGMSEADRIKVVSLVAGICPHCRESCLPCWCNYRTPRDE